MGLSGVGRQGHLEANVKYMGYDRSRWLWQLRTNVRGLK